MQNEITLHDAIKITGGLSAPSKMPCHGWSIPAAACKVGSKLATQPGTVCYNCYALKNFYRMPNVKNSLANRLAMSSHPRWVEAMVYKINRYEKSGFFRWFDSGDLQSVAMLKNIAAVCNATPHIKHWLPTKEYAIVRKFREGNAIPANLTIRLSAYMLDGNAPTTDLPTSTVVTSNCFTCPASKQGNKCNSCRNCWDQSVKNVAYHAH